MSSFVVRRVVAAATTLAVAALGLVAAESANAHGGHGKSGGDRLSITVLSGEPDQVTGGDALVQVSLPRKVRPRDVRVTLDGEDVTSAFDAASDRRLVGLVDGLEEGKNRLRAVVTRSHRLAGRSASLTLVNHPTSGPIFSGPQQQPFVCTTARGRFDGRKILGQPIVDNQDRLGIAVAREDADGDYPQDARGYPTAEAGRRRLERRLRRRDAASATSTARPPTTGSTGSTTRPARRPTPRRPRRWTADRAVRGALGARHDQPVRLQRRDAGTGRRRRTRAARRLALEPPPRLQLPGRRRDRAHPGHDQRQRDAAGRPARARATA